MKSTNLMLLSFKSFPIRYFFWSYLFFKMAISPLWAIIGIDHLEKVPPEDLHFSNELPSSPRAEKVLQEGSCIPEGMICRYKLNPKKDMASSLNTTQEGKELISGPTSGFYNARCCRPGETPKEWKYKEVNGKLTLVDDKDHPNMFGIDPYYIKRNMAPSNANEQVHQINCTNVASPTKLQRPCLKNGVGKDLRCTWDYECCSKFCKINEGDSSGYCADANSRELSKNPPIYPILRSFLPGIKVDGEGLKYAHYQSIPADKKIEGADCSFDGECRSLRCLKINRTTSASSAEPSSSVGRCGPVVNVKKLAEGESCSAHLECGSGICSDNVCEAPFICRRCTKIGQKPSLGSPCCGSSVYDPENGTCTEQTNFLAAELLNILAPKEEDQGMGLTKKGSAIENIDAIIAGHKDKKERFSAGEQIDFSALQLDSPALCAEVKYLLPNGKELSKEEMAREIQIRENLLSVFEFFHNAKVSESFDPQKGIQFSNGIYTPHSKGHRKGGLIWNRLSDLETKKRPWDIFGFLQQFTEATTNTLRSRYKAKVEKSLFKLIQDRKMAKILAKIERFKNREQSKCESRPNLQSYSLAASAKLFEANAKELETRAQGYYRSIEIINGLYRKIRPDRNRNEIQRYRQDGKYRDNVRLYNLEMLLANPKTRAAATEKEVLVHARSPKKTPSYRHDTRCVRFSSLWPSCSTIDIWYLSHNSDYGHFNLFNDRHSNPHNHGVFWARSVATQVRKSSYILGHHFYDGYKTGYGCEPPDKTSEKWWRKQGRHKAYLQTYEDRFCTGQVFWAPHKSANDPKITSGAFATEKERLKHGIVPSYLNPYPILTNYDPIAKANTPNGLKDQFKRWYKNQLDQSREEVLPLVFTGTPGLGEGVFSKLNIGAANRCQRAKEKIAKNISAIEKYIAGEEGALFSDGEKEKKCAADEDEKISIASPQDIEGADEGNKNILNIEDLLLVHLDCFQRLPKKIEQALLKADVNHQKFSQGHSQELVNGHALPNTFSGYFVTPNELSSLARIGKVEDKTLWDIFELMTYNDLPTHPTKYGRYMALFLSQILTDLYFAYTQMAQANLTYGECAYAIKAAQAASDNRGGEGFHEGTVPEDNLAAGEYESTGDNSIRAARPKSLKDLINSHADLAKRIGAKALVSQTSEVNANIATGQSKTNLEAAKRHERVKTILKRNNAFIKKQAQEKSDFNRKFAGTSLAEEKNDSALVLNNSLGEVVSGVRKNVIQARKNSAFTNKNSLADKEFDLNGNQEKRSGPNKAKTAKGLEMPPAFSYSLASGGSPHYGGGHNSYSSTSTGSPQQDDKKGLKDNTGLTLQERKTIIDRLRRSKSHYRGDDQDNLFEMVSKTYMRNLPRLFHLGPKLQAPLKDLPR